MLILMENMRPRGKIRDFSLGEPVPTRGMCVCEAKNEDFGGVADFGWFEHASAW